MYPEELGESPLLELKPVHREAPYSHYTVAMAVMSTLWELYSALFVFVLLLLLLSVHLLEFSRPLSTLELSLDQILAVPERKPS